MGAKDFAGFVLVRGLCLMPNIVGLHRHGILVITVTAVQGFRV